MKNIQKSAWICIKNGKYLVVRAKGKDSFYLPGGKPEPGETNEEALIREIKEELGVDLVRDSIKFAKTFSAQAHGKPEGVMLDMHLYFADYEGDFKPDNEIEELKWITSAEKQYIPHEWWIVPEWL